jgi:hypothetical protein
MTRTKFRRRRNLEEEDLAEPGAAELSALSLTTPSVWDGRSCPSRSNPISSPSFSLRLSVSEGAGGNWLLKLYTSAVALLEMTSKTG